MTNINDEDFMGAAAGVSLGTCGPVTISVHTQLWRFLRHSNDFKVLLLRVKNLKKKKNKADSLFGSRVVLGLYPLNLA